MSSEPQSNVIYDIGTRRYINIGKACTLRCSFCPKQQGSWQVHEYNLRLSNLPSADEIISVLGDISSVDEVVFCGYSEPTLRLNVLLKVARWIKDNGGRVRVNTDGLGNLVHRRNILKDLAPHVDALSISLNAQDEALYNSLCKPQLADSYNSMREFIRLSQGYIKDVTITAIAGLPGVDIEACEEIALESGVRFRRREIDVVG